MKTITKEAVEEAIRLTAKPNLTAARKKLGLNNPNQFWNLLRKYKLAGSGEGKTRQTEDFDDFLS